MSPEVVACIFVGCWMAYWVFIILLFWWLERQDKKHPERGGKVWH